MEPVEYRHMYELEGHHWWFQSRLQMTERVFFRSVMPAFKDRRPDLLDIGCGTGLFLQRRQSQCRAAGLDFSSDALKFSYSRGLRRVMRGDAARLPLSDQCMDIVTAFDILEHVEHDNQVVSEVWRVLRPGGIFSGNCSGPPLPVEPARCLPASFSALYKRCFQ